MDGTGDARTTEDSRETLLHKIAVLEARTHELETECALRAREESQRFLLHFGDTLRSLIGEVDILRTAARLLGEYLHADRAFFGELVHEDDLAIMHPDYAREGLPSLAGRYRISDFQETVDALERGQPFVIPDVARSDLLSEHTRAAYLALDYASFLSVPLFKHGRLVLNLSAVSREVREWTVDQVRITQEVAERTWTLVERARAEAALRQSEERNAFLVRFTDAVRGLSDPARIEEAACRILAEQLGTERTTWAVVDWATREYVADRVFMADGTTAEPTRWPFDPRQPFAADHLAGRSVAFDDIEGDPRIPDATKAAMAERGIRSGIAVPVVVGETLRTVLSTSQQAPRHWLPEEVAFGEALAGRAWAEIERARAEAGLRTNEERMRWQKDAFQAVVNRAALADALNLIARMVTEEMRGEARTAFYLADVDGAYLHPVWGAGDMSEFYLKQVDGFVIGEDSFACGLAIPTGGPVVTPDVRREPRWEPCVQLAEECDFRGCWSFPIRTNERTPVGTFAMYFREPREATATDLALADVVTEAAAVIIASYTESQKRARAEAALRESEEHFRSIANVVPDLLWYGQPDGSNTWYNDRWMEYTSQTVEQAIGWGWDDLMHLDDREESVRRDRGTVEPGLPHHWVHRIRRRDGAYRWFLVRAQPLLDESGRVIRMYGAATDVHEARTAGDELEERVAERTSELAEALEDVRSSEERLRLLVQQVPAMLWATDRELRVTTLMGTDVPVAEWPTEGRMVDELFAEVDANGAATLHRQVLAGKPAEFEFHIDRRTYEALVEPLHDADGETVGTIGVAYDVTDRTLRRLQEDFIASVSHELQTPLTSIRAGLGLLDAAVGDTLGPAERELLRVSRRNAERLRLEIGQLLAANQLTSRGPKVERATIDLHGLVDEAVRSLQSLLQEKDQTISVDMADRLEVEGDRRLLEQVLANLLSNAYRHTPSGTAVAVSGWFVGDQVRLAVHDNGPGIPSDQLEAIFERFYRSPGKRRDGIGLGLAITRDAVEAQGGKVWAESVLGQGTTFFVSLPRARDTQLA